MAPPRGRLSDGMASHRGHEECPGHDLSALGDPFVLLEIGNGHEINHCSGCRRCAENDSIYRAPGSLRGLGATPIDVARQSQQIDSLRPFQPDKLNPTFGLRTFDCGYRTSPWRCQSPTTRSRHSSALTAHQRRSMQQLGTDEDPSRSDAHVAGSSRSDTGREDILLMNVARDLGLTLIALGILVSWPRDVTGVFWFAGVTTAAVLLAWQGRRRI